MTARPPSMADQREPAAFDAVAILLRQYAARICERFGGYTHESLMDVPWWLFEHMCQCVDEWLEGGGRG